VLLLGDSELLFLHLAQKGRFTEVAEDEKRSSMAQGHERHMEAASGYLE
jgi:hypothetical protein